MSDGRCICRHRMRLSTCPVHGIETPLGYGGTSVMPGGRRRSLIARIVRRLRRAQ